MYVVEHECDLSELPKHWTFWWMHATQAPLRTLYLTLRQPAYAAASTPVTDSDLAKQTGFSKSRLYEYLSDLEKLKFLSLFYDEEERLTYITVSPPPAPTPAEEERANIVGQSRKESDNSVADQLVKLWKRNWQVTFGEAYTAPEGLDLKNAHRLIRLEPDVKHIRAVIKFYWEFAHEGEHKSFAGFVRDYDEYAAQKARLDRKMV